MALPRVLKDRSKILSAFIHVEVSVGHYLNRSSSLLVRVDFR